MKQQQMLFHGSNLTMSSESLELIDLFASGIHWLGLLSKEKPNVYYRDWAKLVKGARPGTNRLSNEKLLWLWTAVTSEPGIKTGNSDIIVSLNDEWKSIEPFDCLSENSEFGIFLRGFQAFGYPSAVKNIENVKPDAEVKILAPLKMQPGKASRLECCDVKSELNIKLPTKPNLEQEAIAFKVQKEDIKIVNNTVKVNVKSLNHAYTKASLRLQPNRRTPGGKAYDHVALKLDKNKYKPLEEIRKEHENRIWSDLKGA